MILNITGFKPSLSVFAFLNAAAKSAPTDICFPLPVKPCLPGVEPPLLRSKHSPMRRLFHILNCSEGFLTITVPVILDERVELFIINPSVPFTTYFELKCRENRFELKRTELVLC